ncbi:MAG: hypothetical protein HGB11_11875, partial [Chlorobiales bacterium]|nr:hypothetical protein [Chlorobiales bacterium]
MDSQIQEWYLRIEAVNLDHSVFDTHDISTIRGGSFMLLEVVNKLHEKIHVLQPEVIGASVGLYRFTCHDEKEKNKVLVDVEKELKEQTGKFATFVYACLPLMENEEFSKTEQYLTAQCHWQQYRTLSFALPESSAMEECDMNGVRPADDKINRRQGDIVVSAAVKKRFEKGRELRNELYWKLLGETEMKTQFTRDLESLAGITKMGATEEKIALIHLDGNKFGKIRAESCHTLKDLKDFNDVIQKEIQEPSLKRLLTVATNQQSKGFRTKNDEVRLETLMWGGDEIEWVVPASQLWNTLQIFFEVASSKFFKATPLTYSAGVVVCRHTVPILQIRRYAEQLCGIAKDDSKDAPSNQFALLNMASFDAIHRDVGTFLNTYYRPATVNDFIVPYSDMQTLRSHVRTIRKNFPKNKLYEIIAELQAKKENE